MLTERWLTYLTLVYVLIGIGITALVGVAVAMLWIVIESNE